MAESSPVRPLTNATEATVAAPAENPTDSSIAAAVKAQPLPADAEDGDEFEVGWCCLAWKGMDHRLTGRSS
jgi:hypothetical protein